MKFFRKLFHNLVTRRRKELPFIIFFTFLVSFVLTRIWIKLMYEGHIPEMFVYVKGIHVHHLNFGIFMLSIVGFITINYPNFSRKFIHAIAIIYSIALAWTFDEFAMWLHLEDVYWHRLSYDAVIVICAIFLNIIYFQPFWIWLMKQFRLHKTPDLLRCIKNVCRPKKKENSHVALEK